MCSYLYYTWAVLASTVTLWKLKRWVKFERGLKYTGTQDGPTKYTGKAGNRQGRQGTGREDRKQAGNVGNRQRRQGIGRKGIEQAQKSGNRQGRQEQVPVGKAGNM